MDAMPFDTSGEEEQLWTAAVEIDEQAGREWLRRAELVARAHVLASAAGRGEFVVCEVAAAFRIDERSASTVLLEALELVALPALVGAVDAGRVRLPHARVILEKVRACAPPVAVRVVDDDLARLAEQPPRGVREIVRRAVVRAEPGAAESRRRVAVAARAVRLEPRRDGMVDLVLNMQAETALRVYGAAVAATAQDDGSGRSADARRADWIVAQVLGGAASAGVGGRCQVLVTVAASTASGLDDEPAELDGYGPITADHARELLDGADLRRAVLDVLTGQVVHVGEHVRAVSRADLHRVVSAMVGEPAPEPLSAEERYRPSAGLARTVRAHATSCRFPSCSVRSHRCDLDHRRPHPAGPTELGNLDPLSRRHHRAKQAGWTPSPDWDGGTTWRSPSGKTYRTPPSRECRRQDDVDEPPRA